MPPTKTLVAAVAVAMIAVILATTTKGQDAVNYVFGQLFNRFIQIMIPEAKVSVDMVKEYDLEVIGAGFGRTGTASTKIALEEMGYTVYHMGEVFAKGSSEHWRWHAVANAPTKQQRQQLLREILRPYRAALDFPASMYWQDLMEMYPKGKVLLTVRDTPEQWVTSAHESIFIPPAVHEVNSTSQLLERGPILGPGMWLLLNVNPVGRAMAAHFRSGYFKLYRRDPVEFARVYSNWVEKVKSTVPSDRLLVFNVKQGWPKLASFLGLSTPTTPFPNVNEGSKAKMLMYLMAIMGWVTVLLPVIVVVIVVKKCL